MVCGHEKAQKGKRRKKIAHLHQRLLMHSVSHRHETPGVGGRGRSPLIFKMSLSTSSQCPESPKIVKFRSAKIYVFFGFRSKKIRFFT